MISWKELAVAPDTTLRETIELIDRTGLQIALVLTKSGKLAGVVTDGDVRRAILRGVSLEDPVRGVMNQKPIVASSRESKVDILAKMRTNILRHIPVVDRGGKMIRLDVLEKVLQPEGRENWVVLMAGGEGTRLKPYTHVFPKPLLPVGDRPILEIILSNFVDHGFRKFFISVNYKAKMIEDFFGDGSRWGVSIQYLRETEQLGTAGGLGLLPERPSHPVFVMNGDLLTKVNFQKMLEFHEQSKAKATMGVREYNFQVPYGVVNLDDEVVSGINEKPVQRFFVNAGIYVLSPEVIDSIPKKRRLDMPELYNSLVSRKQRLKAFPIHEYWLDIGQMADFERANLDFAKVFKGER